MPTQQEILQILIQTSGNDDVVALAKSLYATGQSASAAAPQAQALLEQLSGLANKDDLISTLTREKIALQETGDSLALAKIKLAELQAQMSATTTPSAALERSFAKQTATVASLETAYTGHNVAIQKTSNALVAAGINTADLDSEQRKIQGSIGAVSEQAAGLGKNLGSVAVATEDASTKAAQGTTVFGALRTQLLEIVSVAAAVTLALKAVEFGSESVKGAADVEASLVRVQALAGNAAGEFEDLDRAVEQAAIAVNTTTTNAAGGLAALVSQGLSANDAMSALIPTLQLAKIANVDVGTAAGEVATALKAFNIPASEAQSVVDQLTVASHGAAGGLAGMATAAAQLAPDAKTLGLTFTQTIGILGLLESKGGDTEKSLRGLRTIFQGLQNPTSDLRLELLSLGDGTNDFGKAVTALTAGTPRAQQALQTLDGPARSLIETLGQAGPSALAQFTAGLQNAGGEATRTSTAIDTSLLGSYQKFTNAIDLIGEKLAGPVLKPFADELTKLANQLLAFSQSPDFDKFVQQVSTMSTKAAKAIDDFVTNTDWKGFSQRGLDAIDGISKSLQTMADNARTVANIVGKTGDGIGVAFRGAGTAIDGVVDIAATGLDKITALAQAGDSLSEGADTASKNFENLHNIFQSVADSAGDRLSVDFKALKENALALADATDHAADSTKKQGDASTEAAPKVAAHAQTTKAAADAQKGFSDALGIVPEYLKKTGDAATDVVPPLLAASGATKTATVAAKSFSDQLLEASKSAATIKDNSGQTVEGVEAITGAMKSLGSTSQQALQIAAEKAASLFATVDKFSANTAAGLADRQNAFLAYASKALAASAQLDEGQRDAIQANLDSQAAILGVTGSLKQLEAQSDSSSAALVSDAQRYDASLRALGDQMHANEDAFRKAGNAANYASQGNDNVTDSAKAATAATKATQDTIDEYSNDGGSSLAQLTQALADTRQGFLNVSEAAAKAFDANLIGDFGQKFDSTGIGFARVEGAMAAASATVTKQISDQRDQLQAQVADINNLGTASNSGFGQFGNNAAAAATKMQELSTAIQNGSYDAGVLGRQDLAGLQAALDAATQRAQQLADAEKSAAQQLADLNNQLLDSIDDATGNKEDEEDRRYQQQVQQINDLYKQSGTLGSQAYNEAVANANKLHQLNMQQIEQENEAKNNPSGSNTTSTSSASSNASGIGGGGNNGGAGLAPINIHINGQPQFPPDSMFATPPTAQILADIIAAKNNSI